MHSIRWKQRFENYEKALARLQEALDAVAKEPENHLYKMATIQAFEFTTELGWKLLKDYLQFQGVKDVLSPRDAVRQAFQLEIIADGQTWIDMLEARNKTSHTYDDARATQVIQEIEAGYLEALKQVHRYFQEKQ
jgi:nucleotidyltransferase substrate binding protein (TIGR01987 family)